MSLEPGKHSKGIFTRFAGTTAHMAGHPAAFLTAMSAIIIWSVSGPVFGYSDTWQLVINTGTTIVTFLMVFLIQNTQNRDSKALHLKIDELLRTSKNAKTELMDLEELNEKELEEIRCKYEKIAEQARKRKKSRK